MKHSSWFPAQTYGIQQLSGSFALKHNQQMFKIKWSTTILKVSINKQL